MNDFLVVLDFLSTFAFALVGARLAASRFMDYGGILFVASVAALTGGTFTAKLMAPPHLSEQARL